MSGPPLGSQAGATSPCPGTNVRYRGKARLATSGREEHKKCPGLAGPKQGAGQSTLRVGTNQGYVPLSTMTSHIHERICEIMVWSGAVVRHSGVRAKAKCMHDVRRQSNVKSTLTLCQDKGEYNQIYK